MEAGGTTSLALSEMCQPKPLKLTLIRMSLFHLYLNRNERLIIHGIRGNNMIGMMTYVISGALVAGEVQQAGPLIILACRSVLGKDTEPQSASKDLVISV